MKGFIVSSLVGKSSSTSANLVPRLSLVASPSIFQSTYPSLRETTAQQMMSFIAPAAKIDPTIIGPLTQAVLANGIMSILLRFSGQKSLTPQGLTHATILGMGLWTFLGIKGWALCVLYVIAGSVVTKVKMQEKTRLGIAEKRGGARGPENVWGSAATAMVCAILTYIYPTHAALLKVGYVASLATKLSDTFGSEIGKAYGKTTYLITTLKKVPRGTEGAVSLEGTLAGIVGSVIFALAGLALGLLTSPSQVVATVFAAFVATTAESFIGATFQSNVSWLTNELVNLINTLIGAVVAMILLGQI